jgi:hypothetical protein
MGKTLIVCGLALGSTVSWGQTPELTLEQKQGYIDQVKAIALANCKPAQASEIGINISAAANQGKWERQGYLVTCESDSFFLYVWAGNVSRFELAPSLLGDLAKPMAPKQGIPPLETIAAWTDTALKGKQKFILYRHLRYSSPDDDVYLAERNPDYQWLQTTLMGTVKNTLSRLPKAYIAFDPSTVAVMQWVDPRWDFSAPDGVPLKLHLERVDQIKKIALANCDSDRKKQIGELIQEAADNGKWRGESLYADGVSARFVDGRIAQLHIGPDLVDRFSVQPSDSVSRPSYNDVLRWAGRCLDSRLPEGWVYALWPTQNFGGGIGVATTGNSIRSGGAQIDGLSVNLDIEFKGYPVEWPQSPNVTFDILTKCLIRFNEGNPPSDYYRRLAEKGIQKDAWLPQEHLDKNRDLDAAILTAIRLGNGQILNWSRPSYSIAPQWYMGNVENRTDYSERVQAFIDEERYFLRSQVNCRFADSYGPNHTIYVDPVEHRTFAVSSRSFGGSFGPPSFSPKTEWPAFDPHHYVWRTAGDRSERMGWLFELEEPEEFEVMDTAVIVTPAGKALKVFGNLDCSVVRITIQEKPRWFAVSSELAKGIKAAELDLRPFGKVVQPAQKPEGPGTLLNFMP